MKKFIIFLSLFLISMFSYSQKFYAGAYYSEKNVVRPYIYYRFNTSGNKTLTVHSIVGVGMNSFGRFNLTVGQDWLFDKFFIGPGIRFFGYDEMYQNYMPEIHSGLELKDFKIIATIIWYSNDTEIIPGITGQQPHIKPNLGIFYSF